MPPPARVAAAALVVLLLAVAVDVFLQRQAAPFSPQSGVNEHFAGKPSLSAALRAYPKVWPPLYPTVLWLGQRVGLPPGRVNQALFYGVLALFALACRRYLTGTHWLWPVSLFALLNPNYVNLHQYTPEVLFILFLLALLLALSAYQEAPSARGAAWAGLAAAGLFATHFGLFFALPVALFVLLKSPRPARERGAHAALFLAVSSP